MVVFLQTGRVSRNPAKFITPEVFGETIFGILSLIIRSLGRCGDVEKADCWALKPGDGPPVAVSLQDNNIIDSERHTKLSPSKLGRSPITTTCYPSSVKATKSSGYKQLSPRGLMEIINRVGNDSNNGVDEDYVPCGGPTEADWLEYYKAEKAAQRSHSMQNLRQKVKEFPDRLMHSHKTVVHFIRYLDWGNVNSMAT